jgi:DNA polymerase-1
VDLHERWAKIVDDGPGAEAEQVLGPMPVPTLDDIALEAAIGYSARDADATGRIYPILASRVKEMGLERALELDLSVTPMIAAMCRNGILVDRGHLAILDEVFADNLFDIESKIYKEVGRRFLVTSGDQVAEVLYEDLGLGGRRRTKSGKRLSTDEKSLQALIGRHPVVPLILEHREISKLQNTYVHKLPGLISPDGRIRMELGMSTVPSGRLNCWGGVNLLAIPARSELGREIRRAFIAAPSCILGSVDLDQIEMRCMAHISGDERMIEAFNSGADIHTQTASLMFRVATDKVTPEQRHHGKQVGFGIINGITALGLLDQMILRGAGDWDEPACQGLIDRYMEVYPGVPRMFESTWEEGRRTGFIRDSLSGRILWTPGLRSPIEKVESEAKRIATNWKIQVMAQSILKMGMAVLWEWLRDRPDVHPLLQIHDEVLLETSDTFDEWEDVVALLTSAQVLAVPVNAKWRTALNWADLK